MNKKIFAGIIATALTVLTVGIAIIIAVMQNYYEEESLRELESEVIYITKGLELSGTVFLEELEELKSSASHRITLIASDGTVLYDSVADISKMENHSDRIEVQEALSNETGRSIRYSNTLSEKTMYYATRLKDGNVLRISTLKYTALALLMDNIHIFLGLILVVIIISVVLAYRISDSIVRPINEIDLRNPRWDRVYQELQPLVNRIAEQNLLIAEQMENLKLEHEQQDKIRQEFTANVSHELKTPLTSISGFAEIIRDGMVKQEDVARFAGNIYKEAQRLIVLVGDIIKLSQLDERESITKNEELDLYEIANGVVLHLDSVAKKKNVTMKLSGIHVMIVGNEQIVEEMIYNLIDNAIKYNRENGKVEITVSELEGEKRIQVADNGIGIPKQDQKRVFERFYRVNKSHSKEIGGTGLGLSIVKHGVMYHDAKIELESEEGIGTKITIAFS